HLTSVDNVLIVLFPPGHAGLTIQVEEPARSRKCSTSTSVDGFATQPSILQLVTIVQPETLVRWHRAGFRCYWRWKSRPWGGRPQIETDLRALIQRMSIDNPLWGAPRIHGE